MVDQPTQAAINWLLDSDEPAIGHLARRDLLGAGDPADAALILAGPKMSALLAGQCADGGFGVPFYRKWTGAHWRLVSLVELGIPELEPRALAAAQTVLTALGPARLGLRQRARRLQPARPGQRSAGGGAG